MSITPSGAKDQVARLLTLVPFLHTHGQVRIDTAAAALGVPEEQLVKDLKVLLMCGLPGGYPDDLIDVDLDALEAGVIRVSNADYLARPLRLTPTEASAIIVALRALRSGAKDETREVVDRALAKLEAAAAEGSAAPQIDPGVNAADADQALLAVRLRDAAGRGRQIRLTYYVPARDEESVRVVDPHGVITHRGLAYLDAWCHSAEAPRLFRLDRIAQAETLETPVSRPDTEPRDLGDGLFTSSSDTTPVTLRLRPEAHWVTEYYPMEAVRPQGDGSLEVDLQVADQRWLTRLLLRLAPHADVVAPAAYGEAFRAAAGDALRLYRPPPA
ncbi:YafY family protein [Nocardioides sp. cx-173]|uniref:helix-turn-helix transcriptional regulator n=1 Tax=Nocardioides sp. cx-173 TaxID=2898796 RepID=UPI001E498E2F|nr:WYL domain-containing protein [Nocardioides sp. cx-173]MCD4525750.1 WYL domain-containing protein [Nocardioides sp. cx-173]UGB39911.1 WYL domain-containing protein [Nocardioides sp. cx-173]